MRLEDLSGIAVTFVVLAIILGIGGTILTSVQDDQVADSVAYNATGEGLDSISTFSEWLPTLAIIVVSAVVIGVIGFFYTRR